MLAAALACKLGADLSQVIALEVQVPDSLEQYDTIVPRARALNGNGDAVPGATILWATLDSAALAFPSNTTLAVNHPGLTGRLEAAVGSLISNPVSIRTLFAADTLRPAGSTLDSILIPPGRPDSLSDSLKVELLTDTARTRVPTDTLLPLSGRPIVFTIVRQTAGASVTLVTTDTAHARVGVDTVPTGPFGIAVVKIRLLGGPLPDTIVVIATARRAHGDTVPGAPDSFVVRFLP
ncbi:MAG TPA: hypothetical protein VEU55_00915 [Gemmatimonadales bacterium]|nr:hypothetical protein [Gemmatimonadales bacterium]